MAYNSYDREYTMQGIPRESVESPSIDPDKPTLVELPYNTYYYRAGATDRPPLFIPTRYVFASSVAPYARVKGAVTINQAASSSKSYSPDVPTEVETQALNDSYVPQDKLAVTKCTELTFDVTLNAAKEIVAVEGALEGQSELQDVATPKPFHKYSLSDRDYVELSKDIDTLAPSKPSGSSVGSWYSSAFKWDSNYDFYLHVSSVNGSQSNCDPGGTLFEWDASLEIENSGTFPLRDYHYSINGIENTVSTNTQTFSRFFGPLAQGTVGDTIRARVSGSGCNPVAITTSMPLIRVPKGATVTEHTLNVSVSVSLDSPDSGDCGIPVTPDEDTQEDSDSVTLSELEARNTIVLYYISNTYDHHTHDLYRKCFDANDGYSITLTLIKTGDTITLKLVIYALASRAWNNSMATAEAKVIVITFPDGQALARAPGLRYYGI